MKLSTILAPLIAAKAKHSTIMEVVVAFEAAQGDALEKRRESDRVRQAAKKSRDSREPSTKSRDRLLVRAEDSSSNQEISEKEGKKESTSPPARSTRGTRIPDDFKPDIDAAIADGLSRQEAERQALSFCDYWRAKPGAAALKLDWPATWRTWFRRRIDEKPNSTAPPDGREQMSSLLDDIKSGNVIVPDLLEHLTGKRHEQPHSGPTIEASIERSDSGGAGHPNQVYAFPSRGRS